MMIDAVSLKISHDTEADLIGENFAPPVSELAAGPHGEFASNSDASDSDADVEFAEFVDAMESLDVAAAEGVNGSPAQMEAERESVAEPSPEPPKRRATFTAPRRALADALKLSESAAIRRGRSDALKSVRLSINGTVEFSAFNGEQSARLDYDWARDGEAEILVSPKRLAAALKTIKAPEVCMIIDGDELHVANSDICDSRSQSLPAAAPLEEFPAAGWGGAENVVTSFYVDGAKFAAAVRRTTLATDPYSTRYALGGVLLEADSSSCRLAATDSRRMSIAEAGVTATFQTSEDVGKLPYGVVSVIVPCATLERVAKAVGDGDPAVRVMIHESAPIHDETPRPGIDSEGKPTDEKHAPEPPKPVRQVTFVIDGENGSQRFTTLPVEGRFPDWRRVIPAGFHRAMNLAAGPLLDALKLAISVSTPEQRGADFDFQDDRVAISAKTEAGKIDTYVESPGVTSEKPIRATFDPRYLAEFVQTFAKRDVITWKLIDADSAAVLECGDAVKYVVMPLSRD